MSVFTNPATGAAEHAAAYVRAVLALLGDREPMDVLHDMPSALPRATEGLSPRQLRQPECPGKWSISQILQHLADSEVVWAWRMRLILAQDRPGSLQCQQPPKFLSEMPPQSRGRRRISSSAALPPVPRYRRRT
jgi:hypothetical protein